MNFILIDSLKKFITTTIRRSYVHKRKVVVFKTNDPKYTNKRNKKTLYKY